MRTLLKPLLILPFALAGCGGGGSSSVAPPGETPSPSLEAAQAAGAALNGALAQENLEDVRLRLSAAYRDHANRSRSQFLADLSGWWAGVDVLAYRARNEAWAAQGSALTQTLTLCQTIREAGGASSSERSIARTWTWEGDAWRVTWQAEGQGRNVSGCSD